MKAKNSNLTWRLKRNLRKTEVSVINLLIRRLTNTIQTREIYQPSENSKIPIWIVSNNFVISAQSPTVVINFSLLRNEADVCILVLLIKAYLGDLMEIDMPDFDFYDPDETPASNHYWIVASEKLEKEGFVVSWNCVETNVARHLNPIVTPPFELLD